MHAWHSISEEKTLSILKTTKLGLTLEDATKRLAQYGPNQITIKSKSNLFIILLNQFTNSLVIVLILAALVSLVLGSFDPTHADPLDSVLIFAIVLLNGVFGFLQEYKAERTIEELTKMTAPRATVRREGKEIQISSEQIVPGDILVVREGDKVAADARLFEAFSVYADESMLTGESAPVLKKSAQLAEKTALTDRTNLIFMNTVITRGKGFAIVTDTGLNTEVGKIAKDISEAPQKITQFQKEIADIGKKVSYLTIAILGIIIITKFMMGETNLLFIFITAVALGVAAIPEGLPAVVTLTLSIATNRMLKKNALMRRLSTVQDLGSINVICTDKTGTLTENAMTVVEVYADTKSYFVSGKGLSLEGKFSPQPLSEELDFLLKCACLCNDSHRDEDSNTFNNTFKGDSTEVAILIACYKAGMDANEMRAALVEIDEIPFSPERKLMSTINEDETGTYAFVKGAPEVVLSRCTAVLEKGRVKPLNDEARLKILDQNKKMAGNALRVLGFAFKKDPISHEEKDIENNLIFLGLMGMIDPPRNGVKEAIQDCKNAGIRVIMITGDNRYTAEAIGRELGFSSKSVTGDELDQLTPEKLSRIIEEVDIYARTSPKHKVLLLKTLQNKGNIVCMTGDGVNDAAAIKNSDVGIAMGIRGTEVTKQASDIIILDDNFISIRDAVAEGRGTFDNIRKFVVYLLGANISEVLIVFFSTLLSLPLSSKLAIQLLWINLITDGLPALAMGVDNPARNILKRKPRLKTERMLNLDALYFLISIGLSATVAILLIYYHMLSFGDIVRAQSVLFTTFILLELFTVYVVRFRYHSNFFSNPWLHLAILLSFVLQFMVIYTPLNSYFGIVPITLNEIEEIAGGLVIFVLLLALFLKAEKYALKTV